MIDYQTDIKEKKSLSDTKKIVIFGSGALGQRTLLLSEQDKIIGFADETQSRVDKILHGKLINLPEYWIEKYGEEQLLFVVAICRADVFYLQIKNKLESKGAKLIMSYYEFFSFYPKILLPYYHLEDPENLKNKESKIDFINNLLADELSKKSFQSFITFKKNCNYEILPQKLPESPYFDTEIVNFFEDSFVFVDAGSFNGDTIMAFLSMKYSFAKAFCIEPDPENYKALKIAVDLQNDERLNSVNCAVGSSVSFSAFHSEGTEGSRLLESGAEMVEVRTLDNLFLNLPEENLYIKMDVEGFELECLKGSEEILSQKKCSFCICLYHKPDDFWEIPMFLNTRNSKYNFYFRLEGADTMGTVLYAIHPAHQKSI